MPFLHTLSLIYQWEYNPRKLLNVWRMVIHRCAYHGSKFFRYNPVAVGKMGYNIIRPFLCGYFPEKLEVTELIQRHVPFLENIHHRMFLTAKDAICHHFLMLPHGAQSFLNAHAVRHFSYLLKLVNAYNNSLPLAFGYDFHQLEYLLWCMCLRGNAKTQRNFRVWLRRYTYFGSQPCNKVPCILHPQFSPRGCLL